MKKLFTYVGAFLIAAALVFSCQTPESEKEPSVLYVHPGNLTFQALDTELEVVVRCDLHWSASLEDSSWGKVEVKSVNDGIGGSIVIKAGANLGNDNRRNVLVIKAGKSELKTKVLQYGLNGFFSPYPVQLSGTAEVPVKFNAPASWSATVVEGGDWIRLGVVAGLAGESTLSISARDANENVGDRTGVVRVSFGEVSADIPVTQGQKDVILVEDGTSITSPFFAQELSLLVRYNVENYEVETTADWIHHVKLKAPLYEKAESFSLDENPGAESRSGQIHFSCSGHPDASLSVTVTQEGKDPILNIEVPGFYGLNGNDYALGSDGWNHASLVAEPDGSIRWRLLNAGTLKVFTLTGIKADMKQGDNILLHIGLHPHGHKGRYETGR